MGDASIVLSLISLAGVVTVAWVTGRSTIRAKQLEGSGSPYDHLAARVTALEIQVTQLLNAQWVDRAYIRVLIAERPIGHPLPQPTPDWLIPEPRTNQKEQ